MLKGLEFDVAVHRNLHLAAFFKVGYIALSSFKFSSGQVITEFCCNKMHKEADMTVVVILRCSIETGCQGYIKARDEGIFSCMYG